MNIDFYSAFRAPAYNSQILDSPALGGGIAGQFDPMNGGVVYLRANVARVLDASTGRPRSSVEPAGSGDFIEFSTYLHEMIHWWQHIGTTSGAMYGLSMTAQALSTTNYLMQVGSRCPKPLIRSIERLTARDDPALLACSRWIEIEHGASLLYDPELAAATLQQDTLLYHSLGRALLLLHISTVDGLARLFDPERQGLPDVNPWIELCREFEARHTSCFAPSEIISLPLGMRQLAEGHARVSEVQFRCLTHTPMSWREVVSSGLLSGVYGTAFAEFLRLSGRDEPLHPLDDTVNLFLLLCDIALNPAEGYATNVDASGDFVLCVHPGIRFMRLCRAVQDDKTIGRLIHPLTYDAYEAACSRVCQRLGWPTPSRTAADLADRLERMSGFAALDAQADSGDYGAIDVPIKFFATQHLRILRTRVGLPQLFCWPAAMLTAYGGKSDQDLERIQEVIDWHLPPFVGSSIDAGVDSLQIDIPADKKDKFITEYFATQVLYDMARQWISRDGPFVLRYRWKPNLTSNEVERLCESFRRSFGVSIHELNQCGGISS